MDATPFQFPNSEPSQEPTFAAAVDFLERHANFEAVRFFSMEGMEKRLDEMGKILKKLDEPEKKYRTVHVAGTKGKGSVCAMIESICLQSGLKVGRFTSPHLYSLTERFLINGTPCDEKDFAEILLSIVHRISEIDSELLESLTYFELITIFAFEYFARQEVDVAIFEVGMGGRLDATNVCCPDVTVVASISYDHIEQLGPTLAEIAAEKAGIVKPGVPLVSSVRRPEAQTELNKTAQSKGAPTFFLGDAFRILPSSSAGVADSESSSDLYNSDADIGSSTAISRIAFRFQTISKKFPQQVDFDNLSVPLAGTHQQRNASLAIATVILLADQEPRLIVDEQHIRDGLKNTTLPIRVEIFPSDGHRPAFAVDGAHNRSSVRAFIKTLREKYPKSRFLLVFGTTMGKDIEGMLSDLVLHFDWVYLTQHPSNPRRFPAQGMKTIFSSLPNAPQDLKDEFRFLEQGEGDLAMEDSVLLGTAESSLFAMRYEEVVSDKDNVATVRVEVVEDCHQALRECWEQAQPEDVVCVTGSMFLAAELRKYFFERLTS